MSRPLLMPAARFDLAAFGEMVADPSRAAMLLSLMDGCARPASELARIAGVTAATASAHLGRLRTGGFVVVEPIGRHRFFRLAGADVAEALEAVALLRPAARPPSGASGGEPAAGTVRAGTDERRANGGAERSGKVGPSGAARGGRIDEHKRALEQARTCYRHLAGRLGVAWLGALEQRRLIGLRDGALGLTASGAAWCAEVGLTATRWREGKPCLDWTERRYHLGGALGGQLTDELFRVGWLARRAEGRGVRVTSRGRRALGESLGLPAELLAP